MAIRDNLLQQICERRQRMKRITNDAEAWQWIADELSSDDCVIPKMWRCGLCSMLYWMRREGVISNTRKHQMICRLYNYFRPDRNRGEVGDGLYFWTMGVREPRVIAAQLMAIMPAPGRRRT